MEAQDPLYLKNFTVIKINDIPAIKRAREIIETNVIDHWSIGILASKAGINELKLKVGFRQLFDECPYQYLLRLRLEKARDLLLFTDLLVKEISYKVGFETYRGFSKAFKKRFNLLPSEFRNAQKDMNNISCFC